MKIAIKANPSRGKEIISLLGRLLALGNGEDWNAEITLKDERYGIHTGFDTMWYDDIFEAVIAWIEEDIKEGYFNKEYLV